MDIFLRLGFNSSKVRGVLKIGYFSVMIYLIIRFIILIQSIKWWFNLFNSTVIWFSKITNIPNAVNGPGGSRNLKIPLHHFVFNLSLIILMLSIELLYGRASISFSKFSIELRVSLSLWLRFEWLKKKGGRKHSDWFTIEQGQGRNGAKWSKTIR